MKKKILKLLHSTNRDDNILAISLIAHNYNPKEFFRKEFPHGYRVGKTIVGMTRAAHLNNTNHILYKISDNYSIFISDYWLFLEITSSIDTTHVKVINH